MPYCQVIRLADSSAHGQPTGNRKMRAAAVPPFADSLLMLSCIGDYIAAMVVSGSAGFCRCLRFGHTMLIRQKTTSPERRWKPDEHTSQSCLSQVGWFADSLLLRSSRFR